MATRDAPHEKVVRCRLARGLVAVAKRHKLFVFEDCAQAFTGPEYTGHAETDAAMFSFGSIKTATAIAAYWPDGSIRETGQGIASFLRP
jgi:hypothetical protein